jgi:1-acyl-sn-glycerol-3-phosphate acyltransferase
MPVSPVVRFLARAACRVFYRVDCVGTPPGNGAALLLPNHPNALLDPAVIWATAERDVRFLAKSVLFEGPLRVLVAGSAQFRCIENWIRLTSRRTRRHLRPWIGPWRRGTLSAFFPKA